MEQKKRILTGDRPTGKLHIGHYVGVIVKSNFVHGGLQILCLKNNNIFIITKVKILFKLILIFF